MSLESQESTPLEGLESCQRSFTECELIVLDETGSQSEKEDDIVFEKEVRGVCSTNLSPAGSRTIDAATVMIDELGDDEIELICISSQESLDGNSKQERLNNKEEPEREEIAISEESNSFSSHLHRKESFEPDKTGNEERICIFTLPKPEIVIEQGSSSTKIEETYIEKSQSTKSEELQIPSDFFCLNTKPESSTHKKLGLRFRREFTSTLKHKDPPENAGEGSKSDNRCFNCLGDHIISECPLPKNQEEIKKNRTAYHKSLPPRLANRYHEEKEERFNQFKPGVISDSLRRALGLRSSDVPTHIYRMRVLGYPPGWIEEIKENSSSLEFIDTPNSPSRGDTGKTIAYDLSGVIEYPGFNVPLSSRYHDDWQYLNMPPMQPYHLKENLIEQLKRHAYEHNNVPRPKRIRFDSGKAEDPPNLEIIDMDMDAENDTTIEDLEERRLALLAQLQDEASTSGSTKSESGDVQTITIDGEEEAEKKDETDKSGDQTSPKESKLLVVGTPVAIRHSSFESLPDRNKFAKGMGDLELYQNLPNSTGTFQKMRSLLEKVRRVFKKS